VGLVIAFPKLVLATLDTGTGVDPSKIEITIPQSDEGPAQIQIK